LQRYLYTGRYARLMVPGADYDGSTQEDRDDGGYLVDPVSGVFSDGTGPYILS